MPRRRHDDSGKYTRLADFRSIQQQHTSRNKQNSQFGSTSLRRPGSCRNHVSSRLSHQETEAEFDRESVATTIFRSMSKGKRDRDSRVVHSSKDRHNLQKLLDRTVDSAVRGDIMAQQKMCEAEVRIVLNTSQTKSKP